MIRKREQELKEEKSIQPISVWFKKLKDNEYHKDAQFIKIARGG